MQINQLAYMFPSPSTAFSGTVEHCTALVRPCLSQNETWTGMDLQSKDEQINSLVFIQAIQFLINVVIFFGIRFTFNIRKRYQSLLSTDLRRLPKTGAEVPLSAWSSLHHTLPQTHRARRGFDIWRHRMRILHCGHCRQSEAPGNLRIRRENYGIFGLNYSENSLFTVKLNFVHSTLSYFSSNTELLKKFQFQDLS